jgi:hypothetical protein
MSKITENCSEQEIERCGDVSMLQPCHGDPCTARSSHRTLRRLGGTVKRQVHWL